VLEVLMLVVLLMLMLLLVLLLSPLMAFYQAPANSPSSPRLSPPAYFLVMISDDPYEKSAHAR
jgi:hypothetical protein